MNDNRIFPIMFSYSGYSDNDAASVRKEFCFLVVGLPWTMIAEHEAQCHRNHGQTVQRLCERGGLSACEAVAVLKDRDWHRMPIAQAHRELTMLINAWASRGKTGSMMSAPDREEDTA